MTRVVVMPVIPGVLKRGLKITTETPYAKYGIGAWRWWCQKNGVEFVVIDRPLGGADFSDLPPTFQRWHALGEVLERWPDARVAMVDADTMIRWDAPDLFTEAPAGLCGVKNRSYRWNVQSAQRFQPCFPEFMRTRWTEVINCGMVVMDRAQLPFIQEFLRFVIERKAGIKEILNSNLDAGTDQLPFNWLAQSRGENIIYLPLAWNHAGCIKLSPKRARKFYSLVTTEQRNEFVEEIFGESSIMSFVDNSYVWHFNHWARIKTQTMHKVWERVQHHYT